MAKTPVFISWSGEGSKAAAAVLYQYLPAIVQQLQPFYSKEIEKGAEWWRTVHAQLEASARKVGVFVLTAQNLDSRWINFEAGAIAASPNSRVCTLLLGLEPGAIGQPLSNFQATTVEKTDFFRMVDTLNRSTEEPLDDGTLRAVFEKFWPEMHARLETIVREHDDQGQQAVGHEEIAPDTHEPLAKLLSGMAGQLVRIENALATIRPEAARPARGILFASEAVDTEDFMKGLLGGVPTPLETMTPPQRSRIKLGRGILDVPADPNAQADD